MYLKIEQDPKCPEIKLSGHIRDMAICVAAVHDILKEVETDNLADIEFKEVCSLF
jgi:hypothetical protein